MSFLFLLLLLALVIGLLVRNKGDGVLDTMSQGCGQIAGCATTLLIILFLAIIYIIFTQM